MSAIRLKRYTPEQVKANQVIARLHGIDVTTPTKRWSERTSDGKGMPLKYIGAWRMANDADFLDFFPAHGLCPLCKGTGFSDYDGCRMCKGTGFSTAFDQYNDVNRAVATEILNAKTNR